MKIKLENVENDEIEVIIRGNIVDEKVQHIIRLLKSNSITTKILLQDEEKEILTDMSDVLYFETVERKVYASTSKGKLLCRYSLSELLSMFKSRGITQIGKSLLVNVNHVRVLEAEFSGNYVVTLTNNQKLVVSRFYMKDFRNTIMEV